MNKREWREEQKSRPAPESPEVEAGRDARIGDACAQYSPKRPLKHITFTWWKDGTIDMVNERSGEPPLVLLRGKKWTSWFDFKEFCEAVIDYSRK